MSATTPKAEKNGKLFDLRDSIKTTALNMGPNVSKEDKKEHAKLLANIFEKKMAPKEAMKVSEEEIALIYSLAYNYFYTGKYQEACELFKMLFILDPDEIGFIASLAACYHKLKDYETASIFHLVQAELNPFDPSPLFHCYDCFLNLNNPDGAYLMLDAATIRAAKDPKYEQLKLKGEALLAGFDLSTLTDLTATPAFKDEFKDGFKDQDKDKSP